MNLLAASVLCFSVVFSAPSYGYGYPASYPVSGPHSNYPKKITLLHTNDIHARFEEFNKNGVDCSVEEVSSNRCYGGVARMKTVIDAYRSNTTDVLLFDAGDQFQGTLFFNVYGGNISTFTMNKLKYDVMTIGNHEFDNGIAYLGSFISTLNFPVLSSNIDTSKAYTKPLKDAGVKPYTIIKKYNLGVIGFITNNTASIVVNGEKLKDAILDPVTQVQKYVDELHAQGVNRIICVSHNGYFDDIYLAQHVTGVQLIVGGHSHSLLLKNITSSLDKVLGPYPTEAISGLSNKTVYVVQAHRFGDFLGHLDLEWDDQDNLISLQGDPILLDQSIPKDPEMEAIVVNYALSFEALKKDVLTVATADFTKCGKDECGMGALIASCFISEQPNLAVPIDIAFINTGGIRASFSKGNVTASSVMTVLPFGNALMNFDMTGIQILSLLERVAAGGDPALKLISAPQW